MNFNANSVAIQPQAGVRPYRTVVPLVAIERRRKTLALNSFSARKNRNAARAATVALAFIPFGKV